MGTDLVNINIHISRSQTLISIDDHEIVDLASIHNACTRNIQSQNLTLIEGTMNETRLLVKGD